MGFINPDQPGTFCAESCYSEFVRSEILKKKLGCLPWTDKKQLPGLKPANVLDVGCGPTLAWIGASGQKSQRKKKTYDIVNLQSMQPKLGPRPISPVLTSVLSFFLWIASPQYSLRASPTYSTISSRTPSPVFPSPQDLLTSCDYRI